MRVSTLGGLAAGIFPILVGYYFVPSPTYDPGGWGPCGLGSVFPVTKDTGPVITHYGLDGYECVYSPTGIVIFVVVLGGLFALSGAFTILVSKSLSIVLSAIPAAVAVSTLLIAMTADYDFDVIPTVAIGGSVLFCAICLAALGGRLARGDA